jgi:hypothetical protein
LFKKKEEEEATVGKTGADTKGLSDEQRRTGFHLILIHFIHCTSSQFLLQRTQVKYQKRNVKKK